MRILHLSNTSIWPPMDGAGLRTCQLLRRVATRHEVHALQLCAPERAADDRATPAHVDADWLEQACSRLWSVSKDPAEVRVLFGFLHDAAAIRTGLKGALDRDYDVVWGHSADWAYFLPRHLLGRTLLDVQDCYDLSYRRQAKAASLRRRAKLAVKRRLYRYYARKYMSAVNTLVMVNQADADSVARILPGAKVEVVANGVDTRYYAPPGDWSRRPDAPTLVFTGVMSARQNVDAVRFFARRVAAYSRERAGLLFPDRRQVAWQKGKGAGGSSCGRSSSWWCPGHPAVPVGRHAVRGADDIRDRHQEQDPRGVGGRMRGGQHGIGRRSPESPAR